jgi:acetyl esterase/lipase
MKNLIALLSAAILVTAVPAFADTTSCAIPGTNNDFLGIQTIRLWPGPAPEAKGTTCFDIPAITIFSPRQGTANGSAIIIFPGGGYNILAGDLEGREVADWFTARGFTAFIVSYRLTSHGYIMPVPLLDARRAIQTVRVRAADYHISPDRIVIIGFSAGGHLAALASTEPVPGDPEAEDLVARVSSRPDFVVLGYPWLGAIQADTSHLNYCLAFNLMDKCAELTQADSPLLHVTKDTPPTFIYHTFDDQTVPVEQSLSYYDALVKAGVQSELHVFAHGSHGSGMGKGDPALDQWPALLEIWLRAHGLLTPASAAAKP